MSNENESEVMQDILALTHKEAVPFLNRFRSPRDLAEYIGRDVHPDTIRSDPNVAEIEAYSRILANQPQQAFAAFDRLTRIASEYKGPSTWVQEVARRGESVKLLLEAAPAEAFKQLGEWRAQTLAALKLDTMK
jgi:hypothetical protein